MSKAETFISDCTRNCSNIEYTQDVYTPSYHPWLSIDEARKAVEIAREEMIERTCEWLSKHARKYYFNKEKYLGTDELVEDYKLTMTMKDETQDL